MVVEDEFSITTPLQKIGVYLSLDLFSPIKNHDGVDTPNKASRIWFLFVLFISFFLAWKISKGDFVMVSICTFIFSTLLLNLGWVLIIQFSNNKTPILLTELLSNKEVLEQE